MFKRIIDSLFLGFLVMVSITGCSTQSADLVVINARIWTGNPRAPEAEAIAVVRDRLIVVGSNKDAAQRVGPQTRLIDAQGRRVIPGLIDCHIHIVGGGLTLDRLNLRDTASKEDFIARITKAAGEHSLGEWVLGGRWSAESWTSVEQPQKEWIDPGTGDVPVFLQRMDGHQALANSAALKLAGIDANGPADPPGGEIERDLITHEPTGILKDDAMALVDRHIPPVSDDRRDAALLKAMRHANSRGLTGVHDMSGLEDLACFERVCATGKASLRIRSFIMVSDWQPQFETAERFKNDEWVTVAGFKGYMDGSLGSRTACMFDPYDDVAADETNPTGLLSAQATPPSRIQDDIVQADMQGYQIVVHAIGDRANSLLLDGYAMAVDANPKRDRRHRVEHAQHLRAGDINRFASQGIIASMQPLHKADDARYAEKAIGFSRCRTSYAYRELLDAGAVVCFGSDWPVVSLNPMRGLAAAVTALTMDGDVWMPHQSISVEDALRSYTSRAAYAGYAETEMGTLEVGKLADLVILDADLLTVEPQKLEDIRPKTTIVGGKVVWEAGD